MEEVTNDNGNVAFEHLPDGEIEFIINAAYPTALAIPEKNDSRPQRPRFMLPLDSKNSERKVLWYLPKDKGILWGQLTNDDGDIPEGTEITAENEETDLEENTPRTFKFVVGKNGWVKSDIVPLGTYRLKTPEGVKVPEVLRIRGFR